MDGAIRSNEHCPVCRGKFISITVGRNQDLGCPEHGTRPRRYYIDARKFGAKKIYKDKRGKVFQYHEHAHRQLEEMRAQRDRGTFDAEDWIPAKLREYRLDAEARKWVEWVRAKKSYSYWQSAKNIVERHLIPSLGEMDVRDVRRGHIHDWIISLEAKELGAQSVANYRDGLASFLSWLADREDIKEVPTVPAVDVPFVERPWIGAKAQSEILNEITVRHRLIFELMIATGCRPGEIAALRVKDVENGEILIEKAIDRRGKVKGTKSGRKSYKAVSSDLFNRLMAHAGGRFGMEFLFRNRHGNPYRTNGLSGIWKGAAEAAGWPIDMYRGTRTSRASQTLRRREVETARIIAEELGNTPAIAMKHYARDRKEELSADCPQTKEDRSKDSKR